MLLAQADEPLQAKTKLTDWPHGAMATEATESGPSDVDKRVLAMCYKKASMIYNRRKSGTSQMNKRGIKNKRRPKEERGTRAAILRELPLATCQATLAELWVVQKMPLGNEVSRGLFGDGALGILLDEFNEWSLTYSLSRELPDLVSPSGTVIPPADFNFLVTRGGQGRLTGPPGFG